MNRTLWISVVGGLVGLTIATWALITMVRSNEWMWWLIPVALCVAAVVLRKRSYWTKTALIYACVVSIILISAMDIHAWYQQQKESKASTQAPQGSGAPKPPAGIPAVAPNTPPAGAVTDAAQQLADTKAEMEKLKEDLGALQAKQSAGQGSMPGDTIPAGNNDTPVAQPPDDLSGISPEGGDEGPRLVKAKNCWYSDINEMTCRFFVVSKERQPRTMDVMDSQGTADNGEESRPFIVARFGGGIRYADGSNRIVLVHDVRNDILATFKEPDGEVSKVSFTLNMSGMDARNHMYPFANIPVIKSRH